MPIVYSSTTESASGAPVAAALSEARSLAAAFAPVCSWRGEAIAVRCGEQAISYRELDKQANSIAVSLAQRGVTRGSLVAIHLPRSIEMVAAMLGVCKAGAAYLPIDPTFPIVRVLETLADAQPALLLTHSDLRSQLGEVRADTLLIHDALTEPDASALETQTGPDDLAYVIYTSGSTGRAKGVMVSQRNVLRLFSETSQWFSFNEHDVWTMFHSFAFDFSVWEMWGPLLTGGTLIIVPYATSRSPEDFLALLSREKVTVLNQTPSAFNLLCSAVEARSLPLDLRYVIFGGEALSLPSLRSWVQRFGDEHPSLINMYGITETTVHVTRRRIRQQDVEREAESLIGEPIPDLQLYLLDDNLQPVRHGETGEMYIGGAGVALGYLHRPELTAERFLHDPLSGGRLYRSGDLARRRADGELVYLGRADRQVKINGFRVEPGEVEAAIALFPDVQQACVTPFCAADGTQFLAAYVVAAEELDRSALSAAVAERLPAHMRPTFYSQMSALPLTANGKLDRDALPRPEMAANQSEFINDGPVAKQIASLWAQVLQLPSVSERENFFDAGGTSLQLMALRTALQQKLERDVPVLWLFEHTTPEKLAMKLMQNSADEALQSARMQSPADRQRQSFARARALRSVPS